MSGAHGHDQDHGHGHSHAHGHSGPSASDPAHPHNAPLSDVQLRVKALESLLTERGLVDPAALDELIDTYETKVGPRNGARVVAKAWVDPEFKRRLLADATAERLAEEIKRVQAAGDPDRGDTYYHHWLATLERLVAEKRLVGVDELHRRKAEWDAAARATPHGQPIELLRGRDAGS